MWGSLASLGAAAVSGFASYAGQREANQANRDIARDATEASMKEAAMNRAFQADMSNSAHQRAVKDLRAAGLNPILAANNGASTPSGAMGQPQTAHMEDALGKGVSSAMEARRLKKELDATDSQVDLNHALKETQKAQTKLNESNAKVAEKNAKVIDTQMPAIQQKAKLDVKRDRLNEKAAVFDAYNSRINTAVGTISNAVNALKPPITVNKPLRKEVTIDKEGRVIDERLIKD